MDNLSFKPFLLSSIALIVVGWGGLATMIFILKLPPLVWPRWGFYVLWVMALTGSALPIVYFINWRFPSVPRADQNAIVREALWVGIYGATLAWLQLGHLVTLYVVLGLAGGLIAVEYFIRLRENARRPQNSYD